GKRAGLPPVLHRLKAVIDHETAPLGFQSLARAHQLLTLSMNGTRAFLCFGGHAYDRQRSAIALDEAVQLYAERFGVEPIGLYPLVLLIQLLRTDHIAVDRERTQVALQRKTKSTRFIDGVDFCGLAPEFCRPMQKRLLLETLRRFGIAPLYLLDHHVKILVHINSQLDHSSAAIKLAAGSLV